MGDIMQRKSLKNQDRILIRFRGPLSLATGDVVEVKGINEMNLYEIWNILMERYGDKARSEGVYPALEELLSQNLILIDGVEVSALNGIRTRVKAGNDIIIINFTHGG